MTTIQPRDLGDNINKARRLGKVDELTGLAIDNGTVSPKNGTGIVINETIGGDDYSDYIRFRITKPLTISIDTDGAIAQLINSQGQVVVDSSDGYNSNLSAQLEAGIYYIGFSSESSTLEMFNSIINFI
jgi:hypothetical protein